MNYQDREMEDPIVPLHDALQSDNSFKVPASYFESLPDRIMKLVELQSVPPTYKEDAFQVPNGYFENFTNTLFEKIQLNQKPKIIRTAFHRIYAYSAAAVVVLVLSLFLIKYYSGQKSIDFLANSSEEDLLEYVTAHEDEFDQNSLAIAMNEDEVNSLDVMGDVDDETTNMLIEMYK